MSNHKIKSSLRKEIEELEIKKAKIEDLAIEGTFDKDRFIKKIKKVEKNISFVKEKIIIAICIDIYTKLW